MNVFEKLAKGLYRKTANGDLNNATINNNKEQRMLNFIFILLSFLLIPLIWNIYEDKAVTPLVEINVADWKSYFPEKNSGQCNLNDINEPKCIAHPENPLLWESNIKRFSEEYFSKANLPKTEFWLGTVISESTLHTLRSHFANYLVIQQIEGSYEVWMDGSLVGRGSYKNNDYPLVFPISMARLMGKPLYLAIHIQNNIFTTNLESNDFRKRKDGFYTDLDFEGVLRWQSAAGQTGNLILVALYILMAILFYVTARYDKKQTEYSSATGLAGCLAIFHLLYVDAMYRFISPELWYSLLAGVLFALAILILRFAITYSRSRVGIESTLFYLLISSFLLVSLFLNDINLTSNLIDLLARYGIPFCYLAGSISLFLQFNYLAQKEPNDYSSRRENLAFMCTMYFLGAVITFVQYQQVYDVTIETPTGLWINIVVLCFLAVKTGKKITSQLDLFLRAPISSFHRRTTLPTRVDGSILMIDLKSSEDFFRQGAQMNRGGTIMNVILSNLWAYFKQEGLTVLQGEGDAIIALWELGKNDQPDKIIKTIIGLDIFLNNLSENLIENGVRMDNSIFFRSTIIEGAVKPIWREIENEKIPAWIEAGEKNVFVDASRLLAIEKEVVPNQDRSSLIVLGELAEKYQKMAPEFNHRWGIHKVDCISKHSKIYNVSVLFPGNAKSETGAAKAQIAK
jgi:hypothetical protein